MSYRSRVCTSGGEKTGPPTTSQFVSQHRGRLTPRTAETALLGWMREGVVTSRSEGPFRGCHSRYKFLLSGALSVRKLTRAKAQNTTHFHSRLYYAHPTRRNTKNGKNWRPGQDNDSTWDRRARKRTSRQKQYRSKP